VTISENADPDVVHDVLAALDRIVPWRHPDYRHSEGNSAAHVKAILVGPGVAVPVRAGRLVLGQWQALFFCEFDGPGRGASWCNWWQPARALQVTRVWHRVGSGPQERAAAYDRGDRVDVIEVERLRQTIDRYGRSFLRHVYSDAEEAEAPNGEAKAAYYAGRWAAKEAVAKALGTGIGVSCGWKDIDVVRGVDGKPESGCWAPGPPRPRVSARPVSISASATNGDWPAPRPSPRAWTRRRPGEERHAPAGLVALGHGMGLQILIWLG